MFRPIKNLLTYIQKNASGSAIFGTSTATGNHIHDRDMETTNNEEHQHDVSSDTVEVDECKMQKDVENGRGSNDSTSASANNNEDIVADIELYDNAVDIEMQIKSSVMFKKSIVSDDPELLKQVGSDDAEGLATATTAPTTDTIESNSQNDDQQTDIGDELVGFQLDSTIAACAQSVEESCSVGSVVDVVTGGDDTVEEFNTEDDENTEERFLEYGQDLEPFTGSEIIVLNDTDLNSSVTSDAPSEDPLAIDEFTQTAVATCSIMSVSTPNREANAHTIDCDENGSMHNDMLWLDIENMKSTANSNSQKDLTETMLHIGIPQKRPALNSIIATTVSTDCSNNHNHNNNNNIMQKSSSEENAEEFRSDGSDSGLGSETSTLQTTLANITDTSQVSTNSLSLHTPTHERGTTLEVLCNAISSSNAHVETIASNKVPLRSNLKRRLDASDDSILTTTSTSTLLTDLTSATSSITGSIQKKPKRSINFDTVQVYYFPRQQGFSCVPSAGGCTLGMAAAHVSTKTLSLTEHAAELRRAHRLQLQEINPRGSSSDDSEESEEDYLSEGSGSDLDAESNGFLQPVSPKQRRALLKAAGVRKIDASEKVECRDIRNSREICGCSCREFCDPDTCACNQAGIKCQVDRAMFPCGCSRDACGNTVGRVEFNPQRVRIHFIHTIMRLEMENRQQQNPSLSGENGLGSGGVLSYGLTLASSSTSVSNASTSATMQPNVTQLPSNFYGLQPHSNYSSGYASPIYSAEPTPAANYYQPQSQSSIPLYASGVSALSDIQTIHTTQTQYPMDSISANLFASGTSATPAYAELMPSYGNVNTAPSNVYHQQSLGGYINNKVSTYTSYQHQAESDSVISTPPTTFRSCAVPSAPPYGSATTTTAAAHYDTVCNVLLETTTASSCMSLIDAAAAIENVTVGEEHDNLSDSVSGSAAIDITTAGSSFIDLNTPVANATRLSQINDLLQHNRNTTAALVAVTQSGANCLTITPCEPTPIVCSNSSSCGSVSSNSTELSTTTATTTATSVSIDTPPIDDLSQKSCLTFDEFSSPLQPTPIVDVLESENAAKTPSVTTIECNDSKYLTDETDADKMLVTPVTTTSTANPNPNMNTNTSTTASMTLQLIAKD